MYNLFERSDGSRMSRQNPRIEAQRQVLKKLESLDFDHASDVYDGLFIDGRWQPNFHYMQGVQHFKTIIRNELELLEKQEAKWLKHVKRSKKQ